MNMSVNKRVLASTFALANCIGLFSSDISAQSIGDGGFSVGPTAVGGYVSYRNLRTDLCLSNDITGKLFAEKCNASNTYHDWTVSSDPMGFIIKNRATGYCLEMYGTTLRAAVCRSINFQRWFTIRMSDNSIKFYNYGESTCFYNYSGATLAVGPDCTSTALAYRWQEAR